MIVNVVFYGKANAGDRAWVLVDAGWREAMGLSNTLRKSDSEKMRGLARSFLLMGISTTSALSRISLKNGMCQSTRTSWNCLT